MSEDATSNATCVFFGSSFNEPYDIIVGRTNKMIMEWVEKWKAVCSNKQTNVDRLKLQLFSAKELKKFFSK